MESHAEVQALLQVGDQEDGGEGGATNNGRKSTLWERKSLFFAIVNYEQIRRDSAFQAVVL